MADTVDKETDINSSTNCSTLVNNSINSNNTTRISLRLSSELTKEEIVESFIIDKLTNHLMLKFTDTYNNKTVVFSIDKSKWEKTSKNFLKALKSKNVSAEHVTQLSDVLDDNYAIILGIGSANLDDGYDNQSLNKGGPSDEEPVSNKERLKIQQRVVDLRLKNTHLTSETWKGTLVKKYNSLQRLVLKYYPDLWELVVFSLSVKTILNISDITLPFAGIILGPPSSLKTQIIELFRSWLNTYFTDNFTSASFVSHSASVSRKALGNIDMLPKMKGKLFLTPELAPLFNSTDDEIRSQFGIITRVLDGHGLENESGVHGHRGYHGEYMFCWLGAAVDIPTRVYRFLSTIGFKMYFYRMQRRNKPEQELVDQIRSEKKFSEKMDEIKEAFIEYLIWFELCPLMTCDNQIVGRGRISWDTEKDDLNAVTYIAKLAKLLAHIRGSVYVSRREEGNELQTANDSLSNIMEEKESGGDDGTISSLDRGEEDQNNSNVPYPRFRAEFVHGISIIEDPSRANQQLYNLCRAHALMSGGRNFVTLADIPIAIKVVLSTAAIERVKVFDLLIKKGGILTTSQIVEELNVSNHTAKRTMTEFKGLGLVTMERINPEVQNSEYQITLVYEFDWFLKDEFIELRKLSEGRKNDRDEVSSKNQQST